MLIKKPSDVRSSEITAESTYLRSAKFHPRRSRVAGTTAATALAYRYFNPTPLPPVEVKDISKIEMPKTFSTDESPNTFEQITNYNNYYEFGTNKGEPAATRPKADHPPVDHRGRRNGTAAKDIRYRRFIEI